MPGTDAVSLRGYWRLIHRNANFRRLWGAQMVSEIGDWFYALSVYSLVLEFTGRAELVGIAVVLQVFPQTLIGPTAGVINDRLSRRRVMIAADLLRCAIVLGMLAVRTSATVWLAFPLLLLETLLWALFEPARSSVIPNIVSEEELVSANTLSATTWSFNLAVGATLGGAAAVLLGRDWVFVLNALSFLLSAWLIGRMAFSEPHTEGAAPFRARELVDFRPIAEGFRYIRQDRRRLFTVFVKAGGGLMGANLVMLPVMGERVFPVRWPGLDAQRGAMLGMSLLMGARGVGALIAPFISGYWARASEERFRRGILFGYLAAASMYVLLGFAPSLWMAMAVLIVAHGGGSTNWVFSTTLLQTYTDDRFRGRVFSAELGLCMLTISITSYIAGEAIDAGISVRDYAKIVGVSLLLPAAFWVWALKIWPDSAAEHASAAAPAAPDERGTY
jgi:MFS family permease